jgi:hypothetical protein
MGAIQLATEMLEGLVSAIEQLPEYTPLKRIEITGVGHGRLKAILILAVPSTTFEDVPDLVRIDMIDGFGTRATGGAPAGSAVAARTAP